MNIPEPLSESFLFRRPHLLILLLLALLICIGITRGEFHFFGDETRHAVTGEFFRDAIVDHPWRHPFQYTYEYYAKYPALGFVYWPPFFHFVEGVFFLLFGISVVSARLTILAFSLFGAYYWYRIAVRQGPLHLALLSTLIFPLLPMTLTYERVVMLEIPMMATSLAAIHYWLRFVDDEQRRDLWLFAVLLVIALLTSQKAIIVPFFVAAHFLRKWRWRLLKRRDVWVAGALSTLLVVPWYLLTFSRLALSYERVVGENFSHTARLYHALYYPRVLVDQLGLVLTCLGVAGFIWALIRKPARYSLFLFWIFATYLCYTIIQEKSERHTMIWIPVFVYFALVALDVLFSKWQAGVWAGAVLAAYFVVEAVRFETPKIGGIEEVAEYVVAQPESDIIYFQGALNGNFIFMVRKHDPEKRRLVAREKQVEAIRIFRGYGARTLMDTPEEFVHFVKTLGIRYAVIENREPYEGLGLVRKALNSDQFELVRIFPLWGNQPHLQDRRVLVYRFRGQFEKTSGPLVVPMMTLREDIKKDIKRLAGHPWPN